MLDDGVPPTIDELESRVFALLNQMTHLEAECLTVVTWLRSCCQLAENRKLLNSLPADLQRWWQRQKDLEKREQKRTSVQKRKKQRKPSSEKRGKREMKSTMETGTSHGGLPLSQFQRGAYGGGHGNPND